MSDKETITYLTYFYPGSFFNEESSKEVPKRNVASAVKGASPGAFAFQYHDRTKMVVDGETLWGPVKNKSPMHYIGGKVYTLPEVEAAFPKEKILISNMKGNCYKRVIKTRVGSFQPLREHDVLV
jgi:hypothetical protein